MVIPVIIVAIVLVFCALLVFLVAPRKASVQQLAPFMRTYVAHRGYFTLDQQIPENSIPAFRNAVEHGYGVELDVQLTKDQQVVVFHDSTLLRACGLDARVDSLTYQEIKEQLFLFGTQERVPLFTEVLATLGGKVPVIVELKRGGDWVRNCELTLALLRNYQGEFCIESFDYRIVRWFYLHAPEIMRGQLSEYYRHRKDMHPLVAFIARNVLTNFLTRPQFIAYGCKECNKEKPLPVRLCERLGAFRVMWTDKPGHDQDWLKTRYDCLIFQHFEPPVRY